MGHDEYEFVTSSSGLEMALKASEAASLCHSHILQQRRAMCNNWMAVFSGKWQRHRHITRNAVIGSMEKVCIRLPK